MSLAGDGSEERTASGRNGTGDGGRSVRRLGDALFGRTPLTPDQGCYGCLLTTAVLLVTLLVWGIIYWYNEPIFHDRGLDESRPTVQEQIRRRAAGHRPALPQGKSDGK